MARLWKPAAPRRPLVKTMSNPRDRVLPPVLVLLFLVAALAATATPATAQPDSPLDARALSVTISVDDVVAVTDLAWTVANLDNESHEAMLDVDVSPDAVLTNITVTTHNKTYYGVVKERVTAAVEYNASKAAGETAVLLTSAGKGRLGLNVNVAAGTEATLRAVLVEPLPIRQGVQTYRFPLGGLASADDPVDVFDARIDVRAMHAWDVARVSGLPGLDDVADQTTAGWDYEATDFVGDDLVLTIDPDESAYRATMLVSGTEGNRSALFALLPDAKASVLPKDIVFVLDRSGSMGGTKIVQARDALDVILGQLGPEDRFGLVSFDDRIDVFDSELRPSTDLVAAREWVAGIDARGSTDIESAVSRALTLLDATPEDRVGMVVLITDGQPTAGIVSKPEIVASLAEKNTDDARLHAIGIGFDRDDTFLGELAASTRGFYQAVDPADDVAAALEGFYARIATPLLKDVVVTFDGATVWDAYPNPVPDVYAGSHLLYAVRLNASTLADNVTAIVAARGPDGPVAFEFTMSTADLAVRPEVDRLWARQKAATLERAIARTSDPVESAALEAELLLHGLAHQIETTKTSWLVVEEDLVDEVLSELPPQDLTAEGAADFYRLVYDTGTGTGTTTAPTSPAPNLPDRDGDATGSARSPAPAAIVVLAGAVAVAAVLARRSRP